MARPNGSQNFKGKLQTPKQMLASGKIKEEDIAYKEVAFPNGQKIQVMVLKSVMDEKYPEQKYSTKNQKSRNRLDASLVEKARSLKGLNKVAESVGLSIKKNSFGKILFYREGEVVAGLYENNNLQGAKQYLLNPLASHNNPNVSWSQRPQEEDTLGTSQRSMSGKNNQETTRLVKQREKTDAAVLARYVQRK